MIDDKMEDENLPVDEYLKKSFNERVSSLNGFEPFNDDEVLSPKSEVEKRIDAVSIECSVRKVHPLVLGALKYGRLR